MNVGGAMLAFLAVALLCACAPVAAPVEPNVQPIAITLTRTPCFGFCPDYTVTITGEGDVTYVGRRFVNAVGDQRATIPRADVAALLRRFDEVHFDDLRDAYRAQVTDLPTTTISLSRNGGRKVVLDYGGLSAGMPESVRALQDEIDRVAGTSRWVLRDGQPVRDRPRP